MHASAAGVSKAFPQTPTGNGSGLEMLTCSQPILQRGKLRPTEGTRACQEITLSFCGKARTTSWTSLLLPLYLIFIILGSPQHQICVCVRTFSLFECRFIISSRLKIPWLGLPWGSHGWESSCPHRGHGFDPWSGRITQASGQ